MHSTDVLGFNDRPNAFWYETENEQNYQLLLSVHFLIISAVFMTK